MSQYLLAAEKKHLTKALIFSMIKPKQKSLLKEAAPNIAILTCHDEYLWQNGKMGYSTFLGKDSPSDSE